MKKTAQQKALVNVLGVVYLHTKTEDGGDLYLTRFAESHQSDVVRDIASQMNLF